MLRAGVPLKHMQDANQVNYKEKEKEHKVVSFKTPFWTALKQTLPHSAQ